MRDSRLKPVLTVRVARMQSWGTASK